MAPTTRPKRRNNYHRNAVVNAKATVREEMVTLEAKHRRKCMFCGHKVIDETLYGPLYKLNDVVVHYFCILLSSMAIQNGADEEGIWGFLLDDIKNELQRGSTINCCYCKQSGATIACCGRQCRKVFHLPCGLKNGSLHQFFRTFKSFCREHRITQTVDISVLNDKSPTQCAICKENVVPSPIPDSLWAPCCRRNSWFHRRCVQEMALSAGYFFKCPLCNNTEIFKFRMLTHGIYIPSRDASWETVPNAFAELLDRPSSCTAKTCVCPLPDGREGKEDSGAWNIVLCSTCGSCAIHMLCGSVKCDEIWTCDSCTAILDERSKAKKRKIESVNDDVYDNNSESITSTSETTNGSIESTSGTTNGLISSTSNVLNRPTATTSRMLIGPIVSSRRMLNGTIASSSRMLNGPIASSNRMSNGLIASFRRITNGPIPSTSRMSNGPIPSTSRMPNGPIPSTSRMSNGPIPSTSRMSNGPIPSTSRMSIEPIASTSKMLNGHAEASTSGLKNRLASSCAACEATNDQAKTSGYNLRRSSRKTAIEETPEVNIISNINVNGVVNEPQSSTDPIIIDTITLSDDEDDVQIVTYYFDTRDTPYNSYANRHVSSTVTTNEILPEFRPIIGNVHSIPTICSNGGLNHPFIAPITECIDLTLDDD